jgi:hypothetical protein
VNKKKEKKEREQNRKEELSENKCKAGEYKDDFVVKSSVS